jgi:uncharacterized protein YqgC (DUF456 family)
MEALGIALVALVMAVGLIGTALPFLPGLPIVWAAALVYGIVAGFGIVGWVCFTVITVVMVAGMAVGKILPHRRAAARGAPASTIVTGIVCAVAGFFLIPIVGLPLGALAGVAVAERLRLGEWSGAWASTKDLAVGFGIGVLVELGAGAVMVAVWIAWVVFGGR